MKIRKYKISFEVMRNGHSKRKVPRLKMCLVIQFKVETTGDGISHLADAMPDET